MKIAKIKTIILKEYNVLTGMEAETQYSVASGRCESCAFFDHRQYIGCQKPSDMIQCPLASGLVWKSEKSL